MKKTTLTIAAILLSGLLFAQDFKPPTAATTAFKAKYPTAEDEEWEDYETELICFFEDKGDYGSAYFTPKGTWKRTEFPVEESQIPQAILKELMARYKGYEVVESVKVIDPKLTVFKVYLFNPLVEKDFLVTVDNGGKIISEEDLTQEDDSFE